MLHPINVGVGEAKLSAVSTDLSEGLPRLLCTQGHVNLILHHMQKFSV